jgi:hypothetical protein
MRTARGEALAAYGAGLRRTRQSNGRSDLLQRRAIAIACPRLQVPARLLHLVW